MESKKEYYFDNHPKNDFSWVHTAIETLSRATYDRFTILMRESAPFGEEMLRLWEREVK